MVVECLQRFQYCGARNLDIDIKLRGAVLQRLEFADQFAELLALLEVTDGAPEYLFAETDHFRGHRATTDIEHAYQQWMALIDLAEHTVGIDLDIAKRDSRRVVRIDHRGPLDRDTLGFGIDEKQCQSIALARGARGAGECDGLT